MKRILFLIMILILLVPSFSFAAADDVITITSLPVSLDEFLALRKQLSITPQGGAVVFIAASLIYTKNVDLGKKCLTIALDQNMLSKVSDAWYKGFAPSRSFMYHIGRLKRMPFIPGIYIQGTSSETGYKLPDGELKIRWSGWKYNRPGDVQKVFIFSTGGNRPRPVTMRKNNVGIWKVSGASSLFIGPSRMPKTNQKDDL